MRRRCAMMLVKWALAIFLWGASQAAWAQHSDVFVEQTDGQIATGRGDFDNDQWTLGERVYAREFDADFAVNNPGFNALSAGSPKLPLGSQALLASADLNWDFAPMTIGDRTADLFYWDGSDTDGQSGITPGDVAFGPLPGEDYSLTMYDKNAVPYVVAGSDNVLVPGGRIATTDSSGFLHQHNYFYLQDGDGDGGTLPADGIYLWALQLRMPGLKNSLPFCIVFGTPGSSVAALDFAAVPWLGDHIAVGGDYNQNGVVDAADYVVWRHHAGSSGGVPGSVIGDGTGDDLDGVPDGDVDQFDYEFWRANFGKAGLFRGFEAMGTGSRVSTAVPEPPSYRLSLAAGIVAVFYAAVCPHNRCSRHTTTAPGCRTVSRHGTCAVPVQLRFGRLNYILLAFWFFPPT